MYPIYIPSKGRFRLRLTSDALSSMGIDHYIIVEEQELGAYKQHTRHNSHVTLLVLDKTFQANYETLDKLGDTKSKGPGAARNFAWQHSIDNGFDWHWVMDDNIRDFYRLNKNMKHRVKSRAVFDAMEAFVLRYENVGMAGPNYEMFVPRKRKSPPFITNTRIYSCNFIRNDLPFRWRGRYNEDTILSLDMLKAGWCTVQFNAFLQDKVATQTLKGGNTEAFYAKEGTMAKSKMLVQVHPDVAELTWKFNRWHHQVDYRQFVKTNRLKRKPDIVADQEPNEYGMTLTSKFQ